MKHIRTYRHLPPDAARAAELQNWNEDTLVMLLMQFIKENVSDEEKVSQFLWDKADEENEHYYDPITTAKESDYGMRL